MTEAAAVPAGSEGLIALPYLAGERTPVFDPAARGLFAGLTLRHGRGHLFRAAYEGGTTANRPTLSYEVAPGTEVKDAITPSIFATASIDIESV